MPNKFIKSANRAYKLANLKGNNFFEAYLTYCILKSQLSSFRRKVEQYEKLSKLVGKSKSTFQSHLSTLVKEGFIIKNKKNYILIPYEQSWNKLGIQTRDENGKIIGFGVVKIKNSEENRNPDKLKHLLAFEELVREIRVQASKLKNKENKRHLIKLKKEDGIQLGTKKASYTKGLSISEFIEKYEERYCSSILSPFGIASQLSFINNKDEDYYEENSSISDGYGDYHENLNIGKPTCQLSFREIANILGYSECSSSVKNIFNKFKKYKIAKSIPRKVVMANRLSNIHQLETVKVLQGQYPLFIRKENDEYIYTGAINFLTDYNDKREEIIINSTLYNK